MNNYFNRINGGDFYLHRNALDVYKLTDDEYFWLTIDDQQFSGEGVSLLSNRDVQVNRELNLFDATYSLKTMRNQYNERRDK